MLGSVRQRLVLLVLLVSVPLVLATISVVYRLAQIQRDAQHAAMFTGTRALVAAVDVELEKHTAIAKALATSRPLLAGDFRDFHNQATAALSFVPGTWLVLADRNGNQLVNTLRPYGEPLPRLGYLQTHQRTVETGEPQISDVFRGAISQRAIVSVHVPVKRDGAVLYDLIVTLDPQVFLNILQRQQLPEGWLSGVIDRNGNLVARSRDHQQRVGTPASPAWRNIARERAEGQFENHTLDGELVYSVFVNSALSGWSTSIAASQDVVMAPFRRSAWLIGLSAGALIIVSIILAWWAARHIAVPMQSLETAAGALLRGQFAPVGRTGVAEIDHALAAFEASSVALLQREDQFRTLADSIPQLAWMADGDGQIFWFNQRWFDYTGASLQDMQGPGWRKVHHPDHADRMLASLRHSFQTGEPWEDTFPLRGADGQYRWFLSRALPIRDPAGAVVRWFGTHTDISEQKQTEERQRLLVNELNHRVKNTLAVIQSIAAVTSRSASNAAAFSASFIARIVGIARTHDLLTASHWEGASLRDVLWNELAPYDTDAARRVGLHGEPVHLSPKIAVTLGMVVHEMATNAAKYGALSQAEGRVDVTWWVRQEAGAQRLHLEWTESDGPPMPTLGRQGFGSRLILQSVQRDLEGAVKFDYRPDGLHCVFEFPLTSTEATAEAAE